MQVTKIGLMDADVLVHKVSRAAEKQTRWPNGIWTWHANEGLAIQILEGLLNSYKKELGIDEFIMCLSDTEYNFREDFFPEYKEGRRDSDSYGPLLKTFIRQYFKDNYTTYTRSGLEADDILGILMTDCRYKNDCTKIIMTIDKDLNTIPGQHYNLNTGKSYNVTEEEANNFFYQQIISGDATDGIPGCPTYGPKKAQKVIDTTPKEKLWSAIVKTYESKGLTEEDALINARLVRILRIDEYFNRQLELWTPPRGISQ